MTTSALPRIFGPYLLTRALGTDPLGATYRAGSTGGPNLRPFLLIRTFDGEAVDPKAVFPAMETAVEYLEEVRGQAVARGAVLGIVDDVPFAGIDYVPGQTLDRLLRGASGDGVALPIEHALLIGEKILISLEAGKAFARATGAPHGFLVPGFVSVSNDGDTRVFGAGLGPGLLPSLANAKARAVFSPYLAPEIVAGGRPSTVGDLYSTAAILFECLTGKAPEPGAGEDALSGAVLALNGNPLPDDLVKLLAKGMAKDPARRETDITGFKKALGKLLYGGPYAPSTFNLAFFMHQQFDKSIDEERRQLAAEEQIDPKALLAAEHGAGKPADAKKAPVLAPNVPRFGVDGTSAGQTIPGARKKSGLGGVPIAAVAGGVALLAVGGYFLLRPSGPPAPPPGSGSPTPAIPVLSTPTPLPPPTPVIVGKDDPAFQAALQEKLQEEMKKVQDQIAKEQDSAAKKRQAELEKAAEAARKAQEAEEAARAARERADQEEATRLAKEAEEARQREDAARKAAEAAVPKTKEGDLVDVSQVDKPPVTVKIVKPEPTMLARQRKVSGTVMMRVLVDENGKAEVIEILRDTTPKVGLGEACRDALKKWEWQPAIKDGKRVKSWTVVPIPFRF